MRKYAHIHFALRFPSTLVMTYDSLRFLVIFEVAGLVDSPVAKPTRLNLFDWKYGLCCCVVRGRWICCSEMGGVCGKMDWMIPVRFRSIKTDSETSETSAGRDEGIFR